MRSALLLLAFGLASLGLMACDSSSSNGTPPGTSLRYAIQLNDEATTVATGHLQFNTAPVSGAATVAGTYTLQSVDGTPLFPLTQTSGTFSGDFTGGTLTLRLIVPQTADVGIRLVGAISGATYSGTWDEITVAGPEPRGTFTATATNS